MNNLLPSLLAALALGCSSSSSPTPTDTDTDTDTDTPTEVPCNGTPVLDDSGTATGFVVCADGAILREQQSSSSPGSFSECDSLQGSCTSNDDCTEAPNGFCTTQSENWWDTGGPSCSCRYACGSDADCGGGNACLPPSVTGLSYGVCGAAGCTTNDDCATGRCAYSVHDDGCGVRRRLMCTTESDTCRSSLDCSEWETCAWDDFTEHFACKGHECDIGRPLDVGEALPHSAPLAVRHDWVEPLGAQGVPAPIARALADHWARIAAMEHASVASFARHTLELMSIGAPPELLSQVQRAAADEVRHAQDTFALASHYGGAATGPGPLDLEPIRARATPAEIFRALLQEGCVGETLGAAEAQEAARHAVDPVVRSTLERIADDELRHAQLAWQTAAWMLRQWPELVAILGEASRPPLTVRLGEADLSSYGKLNSAQRCALHEAAWATLIVPMLTALRPLRAAS